MKNFIPGRDLGQPRAVERSKAAAARAAADPAGHEVDRRPGAAASWPPEAEESIRFLCGESSATNRSSIRRPWVWQGAENEFYITVEIRHFKAVLWIILMRIRIRLSIFMPIRIRILTQVLHLLDLTFIHSNTSSHCFISLLIVIILCILDSILKFIGKKYSLSLHLVEMETETDPDPTPGPAKDTDLIG
jgi:hypothetical protein